MAAVVGTYVRTIIAKILHYYLIATEVFASLDTLDSVIVLFG